MNCVLKSDQANLSREDGYFSSFLSKRNYGNIWPWSNWLWGGKREGGKREERKSETHQIRSKSLYSECQFASIAFGTQIKGSNNIGKKNFSLSLSRIWIISFETQRSNGFLLSHLSIVVHSFVFRSLSFLPHLLTFYLPFLLFSRRQVEQSQEKMLRVKRFKFLKSNCLQVPHEIHFFRGNYKRRGIFIYIGLKSRRSRRRSFLLLSCCIILFF